MYQPSTGVSTLADSSQFATLKQPLHMQPLKATQARETNKADIIQAETLVFEGRVL